MKSNFVFRNKIIFIFIFLFACILVGKLFFVQVVHSNYYSDLANRQYATPAGNMFERGTIFFTRKDGQVVSGALQTSGYKIAINPSKIENAENTFDKLSGLVDLDRADFMAKAGKTSDPYEEILNRVEKEAADEIYELKIPGVSVFKEKWRFYPGGDMASQTLGFLGYQGDELAGRYGLERQYDSVLARTIENPNVNFFAEVFSDIRESFFETDVREGDIVTTIEPAVQTFLERELDRVKARYNIDSIGGIIMDPKDGSIYALSTKPDFDPNNFRNASTSTFSNPLVENVLEWGSVVKPLVMAAALDKGVVTASTSYNDTGSVIVEKKEIFNFDKEGRGPGTTMQKVLNDSLNTGMVFVFNRLGKQNMHDYMLSFGIDEKTGVDLPNETSGLIKNLTNNVKIERKIEYANASFGQGIALTPLAMTRALASLGNGGTLVVPHVVKEIRYPDGTTKTLEYPTKRTKITDATSTEITRMLVNVMDQSLKGGTAKLDRHSVAVKTGTAQVANNVDGGYYTDRHTHSFFGYFPAYDPEFIIFLYAVNPKGVAYASQTWADPFLEITKFLLNYYEVPPDR